VYLRLDILGIIDFDRSEASVDATLVDSRIGTFPVTGDMAMRASWGQTKTFALAAGGFNPRFQPPPAFPSLGRLAIALAQGDNPRIRLEAYLALTSNTAQVGARADLYAAKDLGKILGKFSVTAYVGFDTLLHFEPFELIADLGANVTIKHNDKPFIAATLEATLTGPAPWHGWGRVIFDFHGKREVPFDVTIGDAVAAPAFSPADVRGELVKALTDAGNWSAELPDGVSMIVSLRKQSSAGRVLVHPFGRITVRQRAVPLEKTITKFGNTVPQGGSARFEITGATVGTISASTPEDVYEAFAPAQFEALSDDQKLARPSFEEMTAGALFGLRGLDAAKDWVPAAIDYEEVRIDVDPVTKVKTPADPEPFSLDADTFADLAHSGAAASAPTRQTGSAKFAGPDQKVRVRGERYVVATADDLAQPPDEIAGRPREGGSYAEAEEARAGWAATHPAKDEKLQVVCDYELAGV
jgi:hypothetical protein